jgi:hypothetical protein
MSDAFAQAGAVSNQSRYAAATMGGEQFTGLWTQRSPYRDAASAYLVKKFYAGSRFDSILDGINREINTALEDQRSPGSFVWNANTFPPVVSYDSWKYNQNGVEVVRTLLDGLDGTIYDATAGGKSTLLTKSAGAGQARFLGVNTQLFIGDGVDQKKILEGSQSWQASTNILPGTLINQGTAPGVMYMALGGLTLQIVATEVSGSGAARTVFIYTNQEMVPDQFANLQSVVVAFAGLTGAGSFLNGQTHVISVVESSTLGIFSFRDSAAGSDYLYTVDTGTATTGNGTTGATIPTFNPTEYDVTADSGQQWKSYGTAVQNAGITAPLTAPVITPENGTRYWQANTVLSQYYAILDTNGNVEVAINFTAASGGVYKTGRIYPTWMTGAPAGGVNLTTDGYVIWQDLGVAGSWAGGIPFYSTPTLGAAVILDSNQNLQAVTNGGGGNSGGTQPTWATVIGTTTTDGALTWTCLGPGVILAANSINYAYSWHAIDGTVSTASPSATIQGGILGITVTEDIVLGDFLQLSAPVPTDMQLDQYWVWRTAVGQSTLILEDQMPIDNLAGGSFVYEEYGIPDTSNNGQGALDAFIAAPVALTANPPPLGFRPMCYAFQRLWGVLNNTVVWSAGPDAVVGNGLTQFPPLNSLAFLGTPWAIFPVTVQNGGLLVFTSSGIQIILGTGTSSNPFYSTTYYANVSVTGFNAVTQFNTSFFVLEANLKVSLVAVEYPFSPSTGYTEVGLPIGDQFQKVTTAGIDASLYSSSGSFITWNYQSTEENALYVADGARGWFRLSSVSPPESGYMWAPFRAIVGGTSAVQAVETSPGVTQLLIGPPAGTTGPILARDNSGTVWTDNGAAYPGWDVKGALLLCSTGQWSEVAHISAKSAAVGARPAISVLLNEIGPVANTDAVWTTLGVTGPDPARGKVSKSVFSDRYNLLQMGEDANGDSLLVKFDYGTQAVGDVLLDFGIYATVHDEREEAAAK